jgi:hypothetical protein
MTDPDARTLLKHLRAYVDKYQKLMEEEATPRREKTLAKWTAWEQWVTDQLEGE